MTVIADSRGIAEFCRQQEGAAFITIDTEFMRDRTYWPILCLVQVGGPDGAAALDPLAPGIDLAPLYALLQRPSLLKVFHAARQDIEIFYHLTGVVPAPLFDTQVAAMVCGFGDSVSYETLASRLAGAHIDKSSRFTDWSRRPLTEKQVKYALDDVVHLRQVYDKLAARLAAAGRAHWLNEEMAALTAPATYRLDPAAAWQRLKVRSNNRRMLALVHALAEWREATAQQRNLPRSRVVRDEQLLEIAAHAPKTADDLAHMRGLGKGFAESRFGGEILAVVAKTQALPEADYPEPPQRHALPPGLGPLTDLLRVLLKLRCEENDVAAKLVADADDLERIAASDDADVPALRGWRQEIFGKDALDLKHGRLALTAAGRRIKLVRPGPEAEAAQ
ncbi:MAG TPA: ribonuclease D [Stellaceae bacterium]|nr:ribonuclease D [Stellaceae bacterium]